MMNGKLLTSVANPCISTHPHGVMCVLLTRKSEKWASSDAKTFTLEACKAKTMRMFGDASKVVEDMARPIESPDRPTAALGAAATCSTADRS